MKSGASLPWWVSATAASRPSPPRNCYGNRVTTVGALFVLAGSALVAQAEPAPDAASGDDPAETAPSTELPPVQNVLHPPPPRLFTEAAVRASHRLAPASDNAGPAWGIGFSFAFGGRYAYVADRIELGVALDFGYAQHSQDEQGLRTLPSGEEQVFEGQQLISESTFGVTHVASAVFERVRPWVGVGGGLAVGHFDTDAPAFRPGARRAYRPYVLGSAGVAVPLWSGPTYVDVRVDYHRMFGNGDFTSEQGTTTQVLGDLLGFGAGFGSRF